MYNLLISMTPFSRAGEPEPHILDLLEPKQEAFHREASVAGAVISSPEPDQSL